MKKHLIPILILFLTPLYQLKAADSIKKSFTVTTANVEVMEFTDTEIKLVSNSDSYFIQLQPNRAGKVIFSLSNIGYASTTKMNNLTFDVKITAYKDDRIIYPTFSLDEMNREVKTDGNTITFQKIYGSIPVWFNEQVDSINLEYSNSHLLRANQYLKIQGLKILPITEVTSNPVLIPCGDNSVLVGIDGSSSIDKVERAAIANQLRDFVKFSSSSKDFTRLCILEFGSDLISMRESEEKKSLVKAVKKYKRDKNRKSKFTRWTNWAVAFDAAIEKKPEMFIFITDGWSNWSESGSTNFSSQYEDLLAKCNILKSNGTRLLFITSDIDQKGNSKTILSTFLNGQDTYELQDEMVSQEVNLNSVDLITMTAFSRMSEVNFSSILQCPMSAQLVVMEDDQKFRILEREIGVEE